MNKILKKIRKDNDEENQTNETQNENNETTEETIFIEMTEEECVRRQAKETDYMMELLLQNLEGKNLIDNTVIVVFTDHYLYTLEDKTFFTFGGAYSIDQHHRTEGISWWPEELPSAEEYERGLVNLAKHRNCVDYILTHTAPAFVVGELGLEFMEDEEELQEYFERIAECVNFKEWFCGHFHEDIIIDEKFHVMMDEIRLIKG